MDSTEQVIVNQLTSLVRDKIGDSAAIIGTSKHCQGMPGSAAASC
jgi:hypothetical protein